MRLTRFQSLLSSLWGFETCISAISGNRCGGWRQRAALPRLIAVAGRSDFQVSSCLEPALQLFSKERSSKHCSNLVVML